MEQSDCADSSVLFLRRALLSSVAWCFYSESSFESVSWEMWVEPLHRLLILQILRHSSRMQPSYENGCDASKYGITGDYLAASILLRSLLYLLFKQSFR